MKRTIIFLLSITLLFNLTGCYGNTQSFRSLVMGDTKKQTTKQTTTNQDETSTTSNTNDEMDLSNYEIVGDEENNSSSTSNETNNLSNYEIFEDIDYTELEYKEEKAVYTVTAIKNSFDKDEDENIITPLTETRGAIAGRSGIFFINLPYTLNWKKSDKAWISYKIAYTYDSDETIISDIQFIEKINSDEDLDRLLNVNKSEENQEATSSEIEESKESEEAQVAQQ